MPNPWLSAKNSNLATFLQDYDPKTTPRYVSSANTTALSGATSNRDPQARVAIATRLLADGADARIVSNGGEGPLHGLLAQRDLTADDATVLQGLLDGGADVNLPDSRKQAPLAILFNNYTARDDTSGPLYDVLFARPDLDFDAPASRAITVRQLLANGNPDYKPDFRRRVAAYEAARGASA